MMGVWIPGRVVCGLPRPLPIAELLAAPCGEASRLIRCTLDPWWRLDADHPELFERLDAARARIEAGEDCAPAAIALFTVTDAERIRFHKIVGDGGDDIEAKTDALASAVVRTAEGWGERGRLGNHSGAAARKEFRRRSGELR